MTSEFKNVRDAEFAQDYGPLTGPLVEPDAVDGPIQYGGKLDHTGEPWWRVAMEFTWLALFAAALVLVALWVFVLRPAAPPPPRSTDFTCTTSSAGIACTSAP